MPYSIDWLVPNRVMLIRHFGVLTREDLNRCLDESFAERDRANEFNGPTGPLVHTITDARDFEGSDMRLKDIDALLRSMRKQRVGWSIYANRSPVEPFLVSIAHQLMGVRHACFATLEEGLNFLTQQDDGLGDLLHLACEAGHLTHVR